MYELLIIKARDNIIEVQAKTNPNPSKEPSLFNGIKEIKPKTGVVLEGKKAYNILFDSESERFWESDSLIAHINRDNSHKDQSLSDEQIQPIKQKPSLERRLDFIRDDQQAYLNHEALEPKKGFQKRGESKNSIYLIKLDDTSAEGIEPHKISEDGATIGRGVNNTIAIQEESVSRYHVEIEYMNPDFFIRDLGSTTGTFLKITKAKLETGQIFEIGSLEFRVMKVNVCSTKRPAHSKPQGPKNRAISGLSREEYLDVGRFNQSTSYVEFLIYSEDKPTMEGIVTEGGTIGRRINSSLCFNADDHMSGMHCKIVVDGGALYIIDQNSTNG